MNETTFHTESQTTWCCAACGQIFIYGQDRVGTWVWAHALTPNRTHNDPKAILCLCESCTLQGFLFTNGEVSIWPKSRADLPTNSQPRATNQFNPWNVQPTDHVYSALSQSGHYHSDCSRCWLGQSHNWAQHYQSLVHYALRQKFGGPWQWTCEKEREMRAFEREWWEMRTPFAWKEDYRQTPHW